MGLQDYERHEATRPIISVICPLRLSSDSGSCDDPGLGLDEDKSCSRVKSEAVSDVILPIYYEHQH